MKHAVRFKLYEMEYDLYNRQGLTDPEPCRLTNFHCITVSTEKTQNYKKGQQQLHFENGNVNRNEAILRPHR